MTQTIDISVIIPTQDRSSTLRTTLWALAQQTLPVDRFEVILVDDGSTGDLRLMIDALELPYPIRFLQQPHCGPAAARNQGARQANGEIILFLDDDMVAAPELLEQHLESHRNGRGLLVVGPRSPYQFAGKIDPFDILDYGLNGEDGRFQKQPLTFQEVLSCNLSVHSRGWQPLGGFYEQLRSFEDVELAYRAVCNGMKVVWNPKALAYHNHPQDMADRCERAESYTRTVPLLYQIHPELRGQIIHLRDKEPVDWKKDSLILVLRKLARRILLLNPVLVLMKEIFGWLQHSSSSKRVQVFFYCKIIGSYQLLGMRQGIQTYGWRS